MARKVWLLKHPVSADQKEKAKKANARIVDIRYADQFQQADLYQPESAPQEAAEQPKPKRRRSSKAKSKTA